MTFPTFMGIETMLAGIILICLCWPDTWAGINMWTYEEVCPDCAGTGRIFVQFVFGIQEHDCPCLEPGTDAGGQLYT